MNRIKGKRFVLTGKMWTDRYNIEDAITRLGGIIETRVRWADYLVQACGEWGRETGKHKDARNYGVPIIDDKQLYDMIVNANSYEAGRLNNVNGD